MEVRPFLVFSVALVLMITGIGIPREADKKAAFTLRVLDSTLQ